MKITKISDYLHNYIKKCFSTTKYIEVVKFGNPHFYWYFEDIEFELWFNKNKGSVIAISGPPSGKFDLYTKKGREDLKKFISELC